MASAVDAAFAPDPTDTTAPEPEAPETDAAPEAQATTEEKPEAPKPPVPAAAAAPKPPVPRAHETARELLKAKQAENALRKELEEFKSRASSADTQIAEWKANPRKAMKDLGISYTELTQLIAKGEAKDVPLSPADVEVSTLKSEQQKDRERIEALIKDQDARKAAEAKAAEDAHLARINSEATSFVKTAADKYPLTAEFGFDAVREAEDYFAETGEAAQSYDVLAARAEARSLKELQTLLPRLAKNPAGAALISALTNTAQDPEAPHVGAPATAPQPNANGSRKALTSKAAAAASTSRAGRETARLPWGNPHRSSAVDEALR